MKKNIFLIGILATCASVVFSQQKSTTATKANGTNAADVNGKKVYTKYCLTCHQADGGGVQNMNPTLIGTSYVLGDKGAIIRIALNGFNDNVEINGQTYSNKMPSFAMLKDKDIADVLTYVRGHFGNHADAVAPGEVAKVRAAMNK